MDWKRNGHKMLLLPQFDSLVFFDRIGSEDWQQTERVTLVPRTFLFSDQVGTGNQYNGRHGCSYQSGQD